MIIMDISHRLCSRNEGKSWKDKKKLIINRRQWIFVQQIKQIYFRRLTSRATIPNVSHALRLFRKIVFFRRNREWKFQVFSLPIHKFSFNLSSAIRARWSNSSSPSSFTILWKIPFLFCNKLFGLSNSTVVPASITITRSESIMVTNRWAIVNIVHLVNLFRIVCWISESICGS